MRLVQKSDISTGNGTYCSQVIVSHDIKFVFTAPYGTRNDKTGTKTPYIYYNAAEAEKMIQKHGLFTRAIGIRVEDAVEAFNISTANGANIVMPPTCMKEKDKKTGVTKVLWVSEIQYIEDVVIRFVSGSYVSNTTFMPGYHSVVSLNISSDSAASITWSQMFGSC